MDVPEVRVRLEARGVRYDTTLDAKADYDGPREVPNIMPLAVLFWVLMVVWLVFGFWSRPQPSPPFWWGGWLLNFVLFAILGWQVFGPAVR